MPRSLTPELFCLSEVEDVPKDTKPTLLIVDDEDGPRHSLKVIFMGEYNVLMASDGRTAVELAQKNKVDVAVLDVRMAGMSGIEVLERLKYVDPDIEAVMMTAFETTDTIRQALRLRACDYINKPFDVSTMRSAVSKAMRRRTLEGELNTNSEKLRELMAELHEHKMEQQMSKTRGEIYASIIHDINGPLTVISGFIQLLNQRIGSASHLESEDLEFVKERLKTITRQATNCIEISRRYLSFLRRQPESAPRVGVNLLIADVAHLACVHPSLVGNHFSAEPLPVDIGVRMNGTDLIQVLLNLVVNAFQCSPEPHSVELRGSVLEASLALSELKDTPLDRVLNVENFQNDAPLVRLSVRDTGPGIPAGVLPKIFEPYFTTKNAKQGTGLGLNIVLRLIKEANGILQVHSEQGKGTVFTVYLPAVNLPAS